MLNLILAAQLYTLRDQMKTPEDIRKGLERVRGIGYTSVQVSGIGAIEPEELRKICSENGVTVCATHTPLEDILGRTEEVARTHKLIGCPLVGIGGGGKLVYNDRPQLSKYQRLAELLNEAGEKLRGYGLKFAYHNHNSEFQKLEDGSIGYDVLMKETEPSLVGFILDTYWVQAGGANPVDYIRRLKGRIDVIHFKDMAVNRNHEMEIAEIGGGNLNWGAIIQACGETGVGIAAVEQDTCPRDPFDCLRSSYEYLSRKFGLR